MAIGIDNLLKLTNELGKLGTNIAHVFDDGKINAGDLQYAIAIFMEIPEWATIKYSDLIAEYKDLDATEQEQLAKAFETNFDLVNDTIENTIEEGLAIVFNVVKFIMIFIKKKSA